MAKKVKLQSWTKEDVRTLKTLAREKRKTTVIARTLRSRGSEGSSVVALNGRNG